MVSSFSGKAYVESNCTDLKAKIKVFYETLEDKIATYVLIDKKDLKETEVHGVYEFESVAIEVNNTYGNYAAQLVLFSEEQQTEKKNSTLAFALWAPPCYLEVKQLVKSGQEHNLPESRVSIDLAVTLDHHGDKACKNQEATIEVLHGENVTFVHKFSAEDVQKAIAGSFDFTVIVDSDAVSAAEVTYTDKNAADKAFKRIEDIYVPQAATVCEI
jgi:hypothetical protein